MRRTLALGLALVLSICATLPAAAQRPPRFGLGAVVAVSTIDELGFGLQGRVALPVNADFSLGFDLGFTGFLLGGSESATWVFSPQLSGIITLEGLQRAPYVLAGVGAYLPTQDAGGDNGGPTIHAGIGWVRQLTESTFFYEIDPALVIRDNGVDLVLPLRVGLIF